MVDDFGSEDKLQAVVAADSKGIDFEDGLRLARLLAAKGDLTSCLDTLAQLEERYVKAAQIFDLYGEVLIRQGNLPEGIRYKTVHSVLDGIFKSVGTASTLFPESGGGVKPVVSHTAVESTERFWDHVSPGEGDQQNPEEDLFPEMVVPVTAVMGNEFMRQGHFDRALDIFDQLVKNRPKDMSLRELRARAAKKSREKRVLVILRGWLHNIEKIKSSH